MRSIQELQVRRTFCDKIIRELMVINDPRSPGAIEHYKKQLKKLDAELTEAQRQERQRLGLPEPEPVVVALKPAKLFGKSEGAKDV